MIQCARCGWCCYGIPAHLPKGDSKMGMELCPYLGWEGPKAFCHIYGQPDMESWRKTPCGAYQVYYDDDPLAKARPCKMGFWLQQQGGLLQFIKDRPDISKSFNETKKAMYAAYPRIGNPKVINPKINRVFRLVTKPIF